MHISEQIRIYNKPETGQLTLPLHRKKKHLSDFFLYGREMPVGTKLEYITNRLNKTELKSSVPMPGKAVGNNVRLLCNIPVTIKRMKWDPVGFIPNKRHLRLLLDNQVADKTNNNVVCKFLTTNAR